MSVKQRLKLFAESQYKNVSKFEKACNLSNGYINSMRTSIGEDALKRILEINPNLNKVWLIMGEGEMLFNNKKQESVTIKDELPEILGDHEVRISILESFMQVTVPTMAELKAINNKRGLKATKEDMVVEIFTIKEKMLEFSKKHLLKLQGKLF